MATYNISSNYTRTNIDLAGPIYSTHTYDYLLKNSNGNNVNLAADEYITSVQIGIPNQIYTKTFGGSIKYTLIPTGTQNSVPIPTLVTVSSSENDGWHSYHDYNLQGVAYALPQADGEKFMGKNISLYVSGTDSVRFTDPIQFVGTAIGVVVNTTFKTYDISTGVVGGGSFNVSNASAREGETISITEIYPNAGYIFSSWEGSNVDIPNPVNYTASFVMPARGVNIKANFIQHVITWSNPKINIAQEDYKLIITKSGTASSNAGVAVSYYLTRDGVKIGDFTGNSIELAFSDSDIDVNHVYAVYASATYLGNTITQVGASKSYTIGSVNKTIQYYHNNEWKECVIYYRHNEKWVEIEPYYRIGDHWQLCSKT